MFTISKGQTSRLSIIYLDKAWFKVLRKENSWVSHCINRIFSLYLLDYLMTNDQEHRANQPIIAARGRDDVDILQHFLGTTMKVRKILMFLCHASLLFRPGGSLGTPQRFLSITLRAFEIIL